MSTISPYLFDLTSTDSSMTFGSLQPKQYSRIIIEDEIIDMFPYMEIHLNDVGGVLSDGIVSAEGIEFESSFGSDEEDYEGYIENEWAWRDNQTTDISVDGGLGGTIGIGFIDLKKSKDVPKTRAWDDTISNIVKNILATDYQLTDESKLIITNTTGQKIRYQAGMNNEDFIRSLQKIAYSSNFEYSPYLSFFNYLGEFYFCTVDDMLNRSTRVDTNKYIVKPEIDSSYDRYTFKKIEEISITGIKKNKDNYKKKMHKFNAGTYEDEVADITTQLLNEHRSDKLLISSSLHGAADYCSQANYGLYNQTDDEYDYKGFKNNLYTENLFKFRMTGIVPFHKKIASGRIIELEIDTYLEDKDGKSREYSGDWIILSSKIFFDFDATPFNVIEVGKNSVSLDSTHVLKNLVV